MPANLSEEAAQKIEEIARKVVLELNSPGVFAVELFYNKDGSVWVNETACRVHNSGHSTIEAAYSSQFDQMLRCLIGVTIVSTELFCPLVMVILFVL